MTTNILSVGEVLDLATLLDACAKGKRITFAEGSQTLRDNPRLATFTARAVMGDDQGRGILRADQDVRDGFVWLTSAFEWFVPVAHVIADIRTGHAVVGYEP